MKRWYITEIMSKKDYTCSLLSMDAKSKTAVYKSDCDNKLTVIFNKYHLYDFAVAKSGVEVKAKMLSLISGNKIDCKIIFK